jgi:hypothetical protein
MPAKTLIALQLLFSLSTVADIRTTEVALTKPGLYEANPFLGQHPTDARLWATETVWSGTILWATAQQWKGGHKRQAVAILLLGTVLHGWAAEHNRGLNR